MATSGFFYPVPLVNYSINEKGFSHLEAPLVPKTSSKASLIPSSPFQPHPSYPGYLSLGVTKVVLNKASRDGDLLLDKWNSTLTELIARYASAYFGFPKLR